MERQMIQIQNDFSLFFRKTKDVQDAESNKKDDNLNNENALVPGVEDTVVPEAKETPDDPVSRAVALKAQAERMKLEAEKMDAELTLQKIGRLERNLSIAQRKGNSTDTLLKEIDMLQRKMNGESPEAAPTPVAMSTNKEPSTFLVEPAKIESLASFNKNEFDNILRDFHLLPDSQKVLLARSVGLQPIGVKEINATEYALRVEKQSRLDSLLLPDISALPKFTQQEIDGFQSKFNVTMWIEGLSNDVSQSAAAGIGEKDDALVRKIMNEEQYLKNLGNQSKLFEPTSKTTSSQDTMSDALIEGLNRGIKDVEEEMSEPAKYVEKYFPKCIEKEGQNPTHAQIKLLMGEILPSAGFVASSAPVEVYGGYLIQGNSRKEKGDDLIDAIDAALASSQMLRDKLTIAYVRYFPEVDLDDQEEFEAALFSEPKALYVMGSDVSRNRQRILFGAVSAFGIATSWYLSIYPFLMNPVLMKKAEEQVSLADASMRYDLSWLTDLSIPLFTTFIGLQFAHELGHRAVAGVYGLNVTFPTFVPSLVSGITSSITNLKDPPKNRDQLFDFAIAGPLFGIIASLLALYAGLRLTAFADPTAIESFPGLPLEILRQSSLGGGLIEFILGDGVLSLPEAARGSQAVANINVQLHPVAIAGYISLVVNALSLLPIGVTDGGRMSQAAFGRFGKQVIGQLVLLGSFIIGILGNDLFLFYAFFCLFFQQGTEIPQRNEVDDISFDRVLLGIAAGVLCLLTIIPMQ
mmetsp:Transcript_14325/g.21139  ORF Transcript_14325/g.21139 Transcript_14325/m.21139 type:complete len:749 (+) Transcript_14325:320-2566(+)